MTPDLVQGKWDSFSACEDVHVLAGTLKLFLRELPQPLLPSCLHAELRSAAMGHGAAGADIVTSMTAVLAKVLAKLCLYGDSLWTYRLQTTQLQIETIIRSL